MSKQIAYLVDFDGTITTGDLSSQLASFYGGLEYQKIETEYRHRIIPIKEWLKRMVIHLPADLEMLYDRARQWVEVRAGFHRFLTYAREQNSPVVIASDGFGFYIEPILREYGFIEDVNIIYRNETIHDGSRLKVLNPHAHKVCQVCGNCKANHVLSLRKAGHPVVYIGDGGNDRFGASWADFIFARDRLAEVCVENKFPYSPWHDFYDIIKAVEIKITDRSSNALCCPEGTGIKKKG